MPKKNLNLNVRKLILALIVIDLIIAGIVLIRHYNRPAVIANTSSAGPSETPSPSPSMSPSVTPISHEALITPAYTSSSSKLSAPDNTTGFSSGWTVQTSDASVSSSLTFDTDTITINSPGTSYEDTFFFRDGIPLQQGADYTLYFNISSTVNRKVTVVIQDLSSNSAVFTKDLSVTGDRTYQELSFHQSGSTTFNARIAFQIGNDGSSEMQGVHTITIDGIRLISSVNTEAIRVNQAGYPASEEKRCTFIYDAGDLFDVVNAETKAIVYSGAIVNQKQNESTGEVNGWGDFSAVDEPGTYYIRSQIGIVSPTFTISADPYADLSVSLLHMLSLQRCGMEMSESWAGDLAHAICHTETATLLYTDRTVDVSGGWHDAGDYGRYTKTGAKAAYDLLLSWMLNPDLFNDASGGPDSGNGIPDILDEARYEIDWLLKMQESSGGVYARVVSESYPGDTVKPEDDHLPLILLPAETTSAADAGAAYALASIAFQSIDPNYSAKCLSAAEKAYSYLEKNTETTIITNPDGYSAGQYLDSTDHDARFFLDIALWKATGNSSYLQAASAQYASDSACAEGASWKDNGAYGAFLFLTTPEAETADAALYQNLLASLTAQAERLSGISSDNGYNTALAEYSWGSNSLAAGEGTILAMAWSVTGNQIYRNAAMEQISYLLGRNSLNMCFVSTFGSCSPSHLHSRIANSEGTILPGALAGGPDSSREDDVTQALSADLPAAKVYADDYGAYSVNEAAVYYNSAFLFLLSQMR